MLRIGTPDADRRAPVSEPKTSIFSLPAQLTLTERPIGLGTGVPQCDSHAGSGGGVFLMAGAKQVGSRRA